MYSPGRRAHGREDEKLPVAQACVGGALRVREVDLRQTLEALEVRRTAGGGEETILGRALAQTLPKLDNLRHARRYVQVDLPTSRKRLWPMVSAQESRKQSGAGGKRFSSQSVPLFVALPRRDLAWPCCIDKALRIAANRVNRNSRHCTPEEQVKSLHEIGAKPIPARHRHTETEGKHAEENTRPQKLSCSLLCNLACC